MGVSLSLSLLYCASPVHVCVHTTNPCLQYSSSSSSYVDRRARNGCETIGVHIPEAMRYHGLCVVDLVPDLCEGKNVLRRLQRPRTPSCMHRSRCAHVHRDHSCNDSRIVISSLPSTFTSRILLPHANTTSIPVNRLRWSPSREPSATTSRLQSPSPLPRPPHPASPDLSPSAASSLRQCPRRQLANANAVTPVRPTRGSGRAATPQIQQKGELDQSYLGMIPHARFITARPMASTRHEYL